jgi:hypothetical protein
MVDWDDPAGVSTRGCALAVSSMQNNLLKIRTFR